MFKKLERNDPCWCGSGRKYKKCHEAFDERSAKSRRRAISYRAMS